VAVPTPAAAEMTKLLEHAWLREYRAGERTQDALPAMGIDIWE